MARTAISVQALPTFGGGIDDLAWTALDATNDHEFTNDGRTLLLFQNRDTGGTKVVTLVSVADPFGRTGDETVTVPAAAGSPAENGISIYGPFPQHLWNQAGGSLMHFDTAATAGGYVAAVRLP